MSSSLGVSDAVLNMRPLALARTLPGLVNHAVYWIDFLNGGAAVYETSGQGASVPDEARLVQRWSREDLGRAHGTVPEQRVVAARKASAISHFAARNPTAALVSETYLWTLPSPLEEQIWAQCRGPLGLAAPGARAATGREGFSLVCDRLLEAPLEARQRGKTMAVYSVFESFAAVDSVAFQGYLVSKAHAVALSWALAATEDGFGEGLLELPSILSLVDGPARLTALMTSPFIRPALRDGLDVALAHAFEPKGAQLGTPMRYPVGQFLQQLAQDALPGLSVWLRESFEGNLARHAVRREIKAVMEGA